MATFTLTGSAQSYVVPTGVTSLVIECWGAQGNDDGGLGGYARARIDVTPGETLSVYVGGSGQSHGGAGLTGYNGGGANGTLRTGGGASDVRRGGATLGHRVIVAGGGGSGASSSNRGGAGGGSVGENGQNFAFGAGGGGTQTAGGAAGGSANPGGLGVGGAGVSSGGGGGGGYYGGGGSSTRGGGGGSGYVPAGGTMQAGVRAGDGLVIITTNTAPNAPILTAPADGATIDRTATNRFAHTFSDPDAGDSQSKFDHRYRLVGAATWTETSYTTPNQYVDIPGGTFAGGDYEWQVRTYDVQGVVGPYSASSFFTAATPPPTPTITAPINGATVSQAESVTWSTPNQDAYQVRRVADSAGAADTGTVYYDSGEVVSTSARSAALTFATNNRYEHVQVRARLGGLWSQWASVRVHVSWTPPAAPVVTLTSDAITGSITVGITNPAPGAGVPATSYNDVYIDDGDGEERRATMLAPNSTWTYWTPKSGRDYDGAIRVVAVGSNGTTASS